MSIPVSLFLQETKHLPFSLIIFLFMDPFSPKPKSLFSDDPLMSLTLSHRSPDLLQNCDLPPPLKLFSPFDEEYTINGPKFSNRGDIHGVMRALRLAQMRARAAEDRAELAAARSSQLASILLEESLRLSAHRRWMVMLEFEVSALRKRLSQTAEEDGSGGDGTAEIAWCLALAAICFGIAGVGFAARCLF